jgi:glycosyltransferase involved in cell wall biosynthesis
VAPVRVLIVDNTFTFGGAINVISQVAARLDPQKVTPHVITGQSEQVIEDLFPPGLASHWKFRVPWRHSTVLDHLLRLLPGRAASSASSSRVLGKLRALYWMVAHSAPQAIQIARRARNHRAHLIHLNNGIEGQEDGLLAARLLGLPCLAHARGFQTPTAATRLYARSVDHHIAISSEIRENLLGLGVPEDRVTLVHDGVEVERFHRGPTPAGLRESLGLSSTGPIVSIFGRLIEWKGIREFILGFAKVVEAIPSAQGLVVGDPSDGEPGYADLVKDLAQSRGLGEAVHFIGYRTDIPDLMRLSDVVAHCSIAPEPFGLVVAEAMATGTPVVAANRGGPIDLINDGVDGILVDPTNPEQIGGAITELLEDPQKAKRMGSKGEEKIKNGFSVPLTAAGLTRVYERI